MKRKKVETQLIRVVRELTKAVRALDRVTSHAVAGRDDARSTAPSAVTPTESGAAAGETAKIRFGGSTMDKQKEAEYQEIFDKANLNEAVKKIEAYTAVIQG